MRGSLHAHILCWFERRDLPAGYKAIDPVKRLIPGKDNKQRPQSQEVKELVSYQEDHMYQAAHVGRIQTEMARPHVAGLVDRRCYGGYDHERLRIAGLARTTVCGTNERGASDPICGRAQNPARIASTGYKRRWRCTAAARSIVCILPVSHILYLCQRSPYRPIRSRFPLTHSIRKPSKCVWITIIVRLRKNCQG
jgi:hypothetical protein